MKGVVADVCSDTSLALLQSASETFCGENGIKSSPLAPLWLEPSEGVVN
jgi:hypothetical protein